MKILLVEDNNSIRNIVKLSLEQESYAVDEAIDGDSAVYMAKVNQYDLILLDIILPNKMGNEVCKEIRREGIDTPVIMLTSKTDVLTKVDLLENGADDYITKPFSFEELKARIKATLRRPKRIEDEMYKLGKIEFNTTSGDLFVKGKKVYLTRKEQSLLEILIRNRDKVMSRSVITEHVWDNSTNPFSNTIEAHVLNLRKKLGDNKRKLIESVPGRGYKLVSRVNIPT